MSCEVTMLSESLIFTDSFQELWDPEHGAEDQSQWRSGTVF